MNQDQYINDIYTNCSQNLSEFEIWNGYYTMRFEEFKKFYSIFPKKTFSNVLEIGCGIGYQAAFLSCISNAVIASDVDYGDMIQHSRGLDITKQFINKSGIKNIKVISANAESLPFEDEQFDFIYASYSFQYIVNKDKALQEIRRVLTKDGYFFCVLPTTVYRMKATLNYYKIFLNKLWNNLKKDNVVQKSDFRKEKINNNTKWYSKLLPPPDDTNNTRFSEFFLYSSIRWQRLFLKNNHQIILKIFDGFSSKSGKPTIFKKLRKKINSGGLILITKK